MTRQFNENTSKDRRERPLQSWRIAKAPKAPEVTISRTRGAKEPADKRLVGTQSDGRLVAFRFGVAGGSEAWTSQTNPNLPQVVS